MIPLIMISFDEDSTCVCINIKKKYSQLEILNVIFVLIVIIDLWLTREDS